MDQPDFAARLIVEKLPRAGETARIVGEEAAHARARRLGVGDRVVLVDGSGFEAEGAVARVGKAALEVAVETVRLAPEEGPALTLCVAGVRPDRLDWIAEKATELGVAGLVLLAPERAQAFRASAARARRLTRVSREAAKQCGRARWPEVVGPLALCDALALPATHRFFMDFEGAPFPSVLAAAPSVLLVGPEGGWTGAERVAARESGCRAVALPAGKLRTETAAIAALVLLRAAFVCGAAGGSR